MNKTSKAKVLEVFAFIGSNGPFMQEPLNSRFFLGKLDVGLTIIHHGSPAFV